MFAGQDAADERPGEVLPLPAMNYDVMQKAGSKGPRI